MLESSRYMNELKERLGLKSDYALAKKLGITQPEANLIRRGRKVPNPELCIKMANLLERNPVELLLIAQKDKAAPQARSYWALALTAVDVMLKVPKRPKYLPRKVEAIGQELRQLEGQTLSFEGANAHVEAVRLMEAAEHSVDAIVERWTIWKRGERLYPNYLLANQAAVRRRATVRRLVILSKSDLGSRQVLSDAIQVMNDQHDAGVQVCYAFREELERSHTFQRLIEEYKKHEVNNGINAAIFDEEVLMFSRSYGQVPLGVFGSPTPITFIDRLQVTWRPDHLRELSPAPLFDMTRYVLEYRGELAFKKHFERVQRVRA